MWYIYCETEQEVNSVIAECEANGWAYTKEERTAISGKKVTRIDVTEN